MITDPTIRDQAYQYFLEEAPELLETIEQEIFAINEESLTPKERPLRVNKLMRATHTLKGGAANVGLETIKTVAHSLEDVFKALYNPELQIDTETKKLLYESYECLREPLTAEFSQVPIDDHRILDRAATVFAQLQEKFGDYLTEDQDAFPTSEELGLDMVESFFSEVVPERIQELSTALASAEVNDVAEVLRSQAEIFLGLAESLNLPGFGQIAQSIITALDSLPDQAITIAQTAIADLQQAQKQVLDGDRTSGGEPSAALKQLTEGIIPTAVAEPENESDSEQPDAIELFSVDSQEAESSPEPNSDSTSGAEAFVFQDEQEANNTISVAESVAESANDKSDSKELIHAIWEEEESEAQSSETVEVVNQSESGELVHEIWGEEESEAQSLETVEVVNQSESGELVHEIWGEESGSAIKPANTDNQIIITDTIEGSFVSAAEAETKKVVPTAVEQTSTTKFVSASKPTPAPKAPATQTVRVNLESLEHLNDLIGELLINQNRNVLKDEQIYGSVQELLEQITYNEQVVNQIIDLVDEICLSPQQQKILQELPAKLHKITGNQSNSQSQINRSNRIAQETELSQLLKLATESNSRLAIIAEQIKNFNKQSQRNIQRQQRMLLNMRDELIETRMSPIGRIFNRFQRVLTQLSTSYGKQVNLKITGSHILVDKAIEEKLYDPLLHLVRNAYDHGIEPADERRQYGKPDNGKIELRAYYQGSQTVIEVKDDGKGISLDKIKNRGIELNLITPQQANSLPASKILELMFEPGFSTAAKVSDLSGRGVGLDVVRSQIEDLNGTLQIESTPQKGTTFSLQVPLTLTIAKLMLTQASGMTYALLVDAIERIVLPTSNQIKSFENQKVLHWQTEAENLMIPVRRLSNLMEYSRMIRDVEPILTHSVNNPILLLRRQNGLLGLEVDKVLGEQELVIRPLGSAIAPPNFVYGCSILKNSRLTLVIDGAALLKDNQSRTSYQPKYQTQRAYLADSTSEALTASTQQQQLPPASDTLAQTLLVVDDSSSLRHSIASTLQKVSNEVLKAENGLKALEKLHKSKDIKLVVCDLEMPFMNGFQFLKATRQHPTLSQIPIIILTSRDSEKHRRLAMDLGASAYLIKPHDEQQLLSTVDKIIRQKSSITVS